MSRFAPPGPWSELVVPEGKGKETRDVEWAPEPGARHCNGCGIMHEDEQGWRYRTNDAHAAHIVATLAQAMPLLEVLTLSQSMPDGFMTSRLGARLEYECICCRTDKPCPTDDCEYDKYEDASLKAEDDAPPSDYDALYDVDGSPDPKRYRTAADEDTGSVDPPIAAPAYRWHQLPVTSSGAFGAFTFDDGLADAPIIGAGAGAGAGVNGAGAFEDNGQVPDIDFGMESRASLSARQQGMHEAVLAEPDYLYMTMLFAGADTTNPLATPSLEELGAFA